MGIVKSIAGCKGGIKKYQSLRECQGDLLLIFWWKIMISIDHLKKQEDRLFYQADDLHL